MSGAALDEPTGSRIFRVTVTLEFYEDGIAQLVAEQLRRGCDQHAPGARLPARSIAIDTHRAQLELHVASSVIDDDRDADDVAMLQLEGDRAAQYWTRPAATLLEAAFAGAEHAHRLIANRRPALRSDILTVRCAPLGEARRVPLLTVMPAPPDRSPVLRLAGLWGRGERSRTAADVIRDELDSHREDDLHPPGISYDENAGSLTASYRRSAHAPDHPFEPIADALWESAQALYHLHTVLKSIPGVLAGAAESRYDTAPAGLETSQT